MSSEITIISSTMLPAHLHEPLLERGFVRDGHGYRQNDLTFASDGPWLVFSEPDNAPDEGSLSTGMGQPGLWKGRAMARPPAACSRFPVGR